MMRHTPKPQSPMIDTQALGTIYIETHLSTDKWQGDLERGLQRVRNIEPIRPRVDLSDLHDLNKLLDVKRQHLDQTVRYFKSNPIAPAIDESAMVAQYNISVNASINPQSIAKSIAGLAMAPLRVPVQIVSQIGIGALQGIGRELTRGIGASLTNALEASLGSSIGSVDLLGKKIGEKLSASLAKEIKSQQLSNPAFKNIFFAVESELQGLVGKENIAIEVNARAARAATATRNKRERAREGVLPQLREAEAAVPQKEAEFKAAYKKLAPDAAKLKLEAIQAEQAEARRSDLLQRQNITPASASRLRRLGIRAEAAKQVRDENFNKISDFLQQRESALEIARDRVNDLNQQLGLLVNKPLPATYQKFLDARKPGLRRDKIPNLVAEDFQPNAKGQVPNAQYDPFSNKLALGRELYNKVVSGKRLNKKDARIFGEEIDHAVDFDFGSLAGVEANRDNRLLKTPVKTTAEDAANLRQIEKELRKYDPSVRAIERNAKIKAYRYADQLDIEQRRDAKYERLASRVPRGDDPWEEYQSAALFKRRGGLGIKRDRTTGADRRPRMEEVLAAEFVTKAGPIEKAKDVWSEAQKIESLVLDKFSLGVGRKLKQFGQQFGSNKLNQLGRGTNTALNVVGAGYDRLRGVEQAFLGMAPFGLGSAAKTGIQGAAAYSMLPGFAQHLVAGGAEAAIGAGTHLLSGGVGGLGGAAIEGIGGALSLGAPVIGGGVVAKGVEAAIGGVLPNQLKQQQRSIKELQAAARIEQKTIIKVLGASADQAGQVAGALLAPSQLPQIEKSASGIKKAKAAIDKAWEDIKLNIGTGNIAMASYLSRSVIDTSKQLIATNKEVYGQLPRGSAERQELTVISGDTAQLSRRAQAKLNKFEKGLKKIEEVPNGDLRKKLDNLGDDVFVAGRKQFDVEQKIADFATIEAGIDLPRGKIGSLLSNLPSVPFITPQIENFGKNAVMAAGALVGGVVAIGAAISGIDQALKRDSAIRAINIVSTNGLEAQKSIAQAKDVANKLGLSITTTIKDAAKFRSSLEGTGLEGISDNLGQGVTVYGTAQGASKDEIKRGLLAFSQVAGKPKFSAEEANQLDESIPGFGNVLAQASGYNKGRLRYLASKGKIDSANLLAQTAPVLEAEKVARASTIERSPQVKLDKLATSTEEALVKLGGGLLTVVAPAAETAANAIKLLTEGLSFLGTAGVLLVAKFTAQVVATAISVNGLALAAASAGKMLMGLLTAAAPLAVIAGIAALIESARALNDIYSGANSPTKKMVDEYLEVSKAIDQVLGKQTQLKPEIKPEGWGEGILSFGVDLENAANRFVGAKENKTLAQIKGEEEQDQITLGLNVLRANRSNKNTSAETKAAAVVDREIRALQLEDKLRAGVSPEGETKARAAKIAELQKKAVELKTPAALVKKKLEMEIATLEAISKNPLATEEARTAATTDLVAQQSVLDGLNKQATEYNDNLNRVDDSLLDSVTNFAALGDKIADLGAVEATRTIELFGGSLYEGAKATASFNDQWRLLQAQIGNSQNKAAAAAKLLTEEPIAREIRAAQSANKLPTNLRDATPAQLAKLKDFGVNDRVKQAIELSNSSQDELAKNTQAQVKLMAERKTALAQENKALQDNYRQSIIELQKSTDLAKQQTQSLLQSNFSAAFRNSMTGIQGAVGGYIEATIQQFLKLQEVVTTKQETQAKLLENSIKRIDAVKDRDNAVQQYSGTPVSVATQSNARPAAPGSAVYSSTRAYGNSGRHHDGSNYIQRADGLTITKNRGLSVKDLVLAGGENADIPSPVSGRVKTYTPRDGRGFGNEVNILDAGGKVIGLMAHMDKLLVKTGDLVNAGDAVGKQGNTGKSSGTHLHVELPPGSEQAYLNMIKTGGKAKTATTTTGLATTTTGFATTNASVYRPNSGKAIDGGTKDMVGQTISDNSMIIATRLTNTKQGIPYGSVVRLRNPKTGQTVDVKATDTGRLGRGRGIDMTPAVARALGMEADGVQAVQAAVVATPGKDNRSQFALGDGELNKPFDSPGAIIGRVGSANVNTAKAPPPPPLIQQSYNANIQRLDREAQSLLEQQNITISTKYLEAQTLQFKKDQEYRIARRNEAREKRQKEAEQSIQRLNIGDPSSAKASAQANKENAAFIKESQIRLKENADDYKVELKEFDRQDRILAIFAKRTDLDPAAKAEVINLQKNMPLLRKNRAELFKNVQAGLKQDIAIGKKKSDELARVRKRDIRDEDRATEADLTGSGIKVDESLLQKAEQYLSANPFDYRYSDPLTIKKQIALNKQKEAKRNELQGIQEKIDRLDPNAGNYNTQKKLLQKQLAKVVKNDKITNDNIYKQYDFENANRQTARRQYGEKNANTIIDRDLNLRSAYVGYDQALGRNFVAGKASNDIARLRAAEELKKTVSELTAEAQRDPRLKPLLTVAINKAKSIAELNDFAREASRNKALSDNLFELTNRQRGAAFEGQQLEIDSLNRGGRSWEASKAQEQFELAKFRQDFAVKIKELADLEIANEGDDAAVNQIRLMRDELEGLNQMKLDQLKTEFSDFQAVINSVVTEGTRLLGDMFAGRGINTDSLNQFLAAPFKAITDQLTSFVGNQLSKLVGDLLGGLTEGFNGAMGGQGGNNSWLSQAFGWIGGLFGGSKPAMDIGLQPTIPGLTFSGGGLIGDRGISEAMLKERRDSGGREPRLVVANKDEMILTPAQTKAYQSAVIPNYAMGYAPPATTSYNQPVIAPNRPMEPITYRTEVINQVEYVSRAELDAANARQQKALSEYDRQRRDQEMHSFNYRSSVGLKR